MAKKHSYIDLMVLGGTILMGHETRGDTSSPYIPRYDSEDIYAAVGLSMMKGSGQEFIQQEYLGTTDRSVLDVLKKNISNQTGHWVEKNLKFDHVHSPYLPADSIDFCFTSGESLKDFPRPDNFMDFHAANVKAVREAFDGGAKTLLTLGGTDSLPIYGLMLTRALRQLGYFSPGSGQKLLFISSPKSFEDGMIENGALFRAAATFSKKTQLEGGIVIDANRSTQFENHYVFHDMTQGFSKFSTLSSMPFTSYKALELYDAKLSRVNDLPHRTAYLSDIRPRQVTQTPLGNFPGSSKLGRVAPALLRGNNLKSAKAYLQALLSEYPSPLDAVIFEGLPGYREVDEAGKKQFGQLVAEASRRGIACVFHNSLEYDNRKEQYDLLIQNNGFEGQYARQLQESGAVLTEGRTLNECIVDTALRTGAAKENRTGAEKIKAAFHDVIKSELFENHKHQRHPQNHQPGKKLPSIGLHYFPDYDIFLHGLDKAASVADKVVISALPGGAMSSVFAEPISRIKHKHGVQFGAGFYWAGEEFAAGLEKANRKTSAYGAAKPCLEQMDFMCKKKPPWLYNQNLQSRNRARGE